MTLDEGPTRADDPGHSWERIVPPGQSKVAQRLDALMEQASEALVSRRYFECERVASDALRRAIAIFDYDRAARIVLPLQEARRQIRDLAVDAGRLVQVDGELPSGAALKAGMYLLSPPRVGVDGRLLRETAIRREIPVMVIVREPTTLAGLWPVVAVGPVTVRARVAPPAAPPAKGRAKKSAKASPPPQEVPPAVTAQWMLLASEALGDAAIASVSAEASPAARVMALSERLEAVPDHEKLHQRLEEAAREAARVPVKRGALARQPVIDPLEEEDE